ncbi:nuclear transport factor 2 family protein [Chryseobacterium sp. PBS4-4]|uniref:Nuclear transport factor 2 family protein n=1 Tax=Chryseobacterium edaphi TaxID=2976532 RepID=A0ABT2WAW0_9FLAO|nr:nuclear transport factor 2 family protein [Chryseobacterium edaphi]MCU7619342.1 nuclear transport factor 2 family protein [Chryseobacterium edaphi]
MDNKTILKQANAAVTEGDYETFLTYCSEDTKWNFVGDQELIGKAEVRKYMKTAYIEPPEFMVGHLIAEGDFVTAVGKISLKTEDGKWKEYSYCDIWKFKDGKMSELTAFVIE